MIETRLFASSALLKNGTFLVLGGLDGNEINSKSIEQLEYSSSQFLYGPEMPEAFAKHCATIINSTHVFMAGGLQRRASPRGSSYFKISS